MLNNESNNLFSSIDLSYRLLYGKLFSALLSQFGSKYFGQIEDAIQGAFYKSLKSWKPDKIPEDREAWFYVVARNELINQIRKEGRAQSIVAGDIIDYPAKMQLDLRLETLLFFASLRDTSPQIRIIFALKHIFGLHVKEISACTLLSKDAIYKGILRAGEHFKKSIVWKHPEIEQTFLPAEITLVEHMLYAVFNIGFDSFNEADESLINEELCLESLALGKMLLARCDQLSTKNLLSLFCFHLARIPAKSQANKLVPFDQQQMTNWNQDLVNLGFHYLTKPPTFEKFYIEALIISKHMVTSQIDEMYWHEIIGLYEILSSLTNSPIVKVNLCVCLYRIGQFTEALKLLNQVEDELPEGHFYFSLVKAEILKGRNSSESNEILDRLLPQVRQQIRRDHILTNLKKQDFD